MLNGQEATLDFRGDARKRLELLVFGRGSVSPV